MILSDNILFLDGEALVLNKPAGLPVDTPKRGGEVGDAVQKVGDEVPSGQLLHHPTHAEPDPEPDREGGQQTRDDRAECPVTAGDDALVDQDGEHRADRVDDNSLPTQQ